ncbi:MAG: transporter substrate-binding domain-containing protein [Paludibacterium sp.]|uniref:substrate-binding periplasmic protein n=1 Tax=Paludibacterium sp. TaxID=1917523 RepID=UPI0025FA5E9C|nr:transporter substrate-binding domain-containing protein [Paludibacterium sp.]MBV8048605.1 transporter substrate-binding domain-containing protein [Paludibacterium sp.]MBV8647621.1 transporter substrate-binding domain-containing protein [Paludibacterium sp.]
MKTAWLRRPMLALLLGLLSGTAGAAGVRLLTESYPPFNMMLENGQVGGMSTDIVRELFRRAGMDYTVELMPWIRAFNTAVLENNTCVYSTTRSDNREHQFKWIGPLLANPWVLYAGPSSPRPGLDLESVRRYRIGGYNGDAVAQYLIARGFNVELTPTDDLNLRKLEAGRIDYWATGKYLGNYLVKQANLPQLKPAMVFYTAFMYLACNPGMPNQTINRLNGVMQEMQQDGSVARITQNYLAP